MKTTLDDRVPTEPVAESTAEATPVAPKRNWSPPARGTRVGRYEVREPLGSGGMGTVVSAWDPELARLVALKFVGRLHAGGEQERLLAEARAMAQLKHPNVVPVYDVGTWEGRVFLAMEFVDGVTLKQWNDAQRRPVHEVVDLLRQVGEGLEAAHAVGIVHRDVKPANVLVDRDGRARITDFGIARVNDDDSDTKPMKGPVGDVTAEGSVVGTAGYIAPESLSGELATPRADQFALAVTAWQLFTGVLPFPQSVDHTLAERLRKGNLRPQQVQQVPRRLRKPLLRALAPQPERRHATVRAFCLALAPAPPSEKRRWIIRIAAAIVLIPAYLTLLGYGLTRLALDTVVQSCRGRALRATLEVWGPARVRALAAQVGSRPALVAEAYAERWRDASLGACFTQDLVLRPTRVKQKQLDCLDDALVGLGTRLDELMAAGATAPEADALLRELVDPRGCVADWSGESYGAAPWPPPR